MIRKTLHAEKLQTGVKEITQLLSLI